MVLCRMSDSEDQRFRNDVNYRSLRHSSRLVFGSIRKKWSTVEESMRQRRALSQLENESDHSTPPTPEKTDHSLKEPRTIRKTRHAEIFEEGYEFDDVSNLMKTPLLRKTPEPRFFSGASRFSRLRVSMSSLSTLKLSKKESPPPAISPSVRLAKRLANCKIQKMQSPRQSTLKKKMSQFRLRKCGTSETEQAIVEETTEE